MRQQLVKLREKMQEYGISAYIIPTTDFHGSEYVNDYFKCREYVSGFTGSAGTLLVTAEDAWLWTDGRYFIQAAAQLEGSGIRLMKMGEPGVSTIEEQLEAVLKEDDILAFDGRVIDNAFGQAMEKKYNIRYDLDLAGEIWTDRPEITPSQIYPLPYETTGETYTSKLSRVRKFMASSGADYHLITSLEDIAWLFNLRGSDVTYTPVFFAFALISQDFAFLYLMNEDFDCSILDGVDVHPYFNVFSDLERLPRGCIMIDERLVSYSLVKAIPQKLEIINTPNPCELMKALKNDKEIACTRNAHIKDGVAMVEFIHWLKTTMKFMSVLGNTGVASGMTEIAASDYLEICRRKQEGCNDLSFDTISGYGSNGAIVHYSATPETDKELAPEGFLLVDSGGQYSDGTTDITRTIALGPLTDKMKEDYTTVLRGHIDLAMAEFTPATRGAELDAIARKPLLERGMNYNHGTGHGVGHLLGVHEGPQTISPRGTDCTLSPGMITSNEPGFYLEGEYGIRLENEVLCVALPSGMYGFETLTFCPFDREAIVVDMLTEKELAWLNDYHAQVYKKLAPLLSEPVRQWLEAETGALR